MATLYLLKYGTKVDLENQRLVVYFPDTDRTNNLEFLIREVERILAFGEIHFTKGPAQYFSVKGLFNGQSPGNQKKMLQIRA